MQDLRQHAAGGIAAFLISLGVLGARMGVASQPPHPHGPTPSGGGGATGAAASKAAVPVRQPAGSTHTTVPLPGEEEATMAMGNGLLANAHMMFTPMRGKSAADSTWAAWVVDSLRKSIARYRDVSIAELDGYEVFAPGITQKVYHFTNRWFAVKEAFRFDPGKPSSLLYEKDDSGEYQLVGAMYHMPRNATLDQLDKRVPLSVAQWHQHVNLCVPIQGAEQRWLERKDGRAVFGPEGEVTTRLDCTRAGGRFLPQIFGWMVHVRPFETDPARVWGDEHAGH